MYNLAVQLLGQGIPLDGIGCQGHLIVGLVPGDIATNYARFAALGLEWALTGMRALFIRPCLSLSMSDLFVYRTRRPYYPPYYPGPPCPASD